MASKTQTEEPAAQEPEVFVQESDGLGRTRLDRPMTATEAQAQDDEHRAAYVANRANRFPGAA